MSIGVKCKPCNALMYFMDYKYGMNRHYLCLRCGAYIWLFEVRKKVKRKFPKRQSQF